MRIVPALVTPLILLFLAGCGGHSPWAEEVSPTGSPDTAAEEWDRDFSNMQRDSGPGFDQGDYYRYPGGRLRPRGSDPFGTSDSFFDSSSSAREGFFLNENPDTDREVSEEERRRLDRYRSPYGPEPTLETDPYRSDEDPFREYR